MDLREGQNISRPPLLEENKYGYWRVLTARRCALQNLHL
ncbi:unnamed protein product [Rhodiola kirilowii]